MFSLKIHFWGNPGLRELCGATLTTLSSAAQPCQGPLQMCPAEPWQMMEMPWKSALKLWLCPQHQGVRDGLIATG